MKSIIYKLFLCCTLSAVFISCNDIEKEASSAGRVEVAVSAGITTRAVDNQWQKGDIIGLFMLSKMDQNIIEPYRNIGYITEGESNFKPVSDKNRIYFPNDGSEVSFKSYYPFQRSLTEIESIPVDVSNQTDLSAIDFMTSVHQSGGSIVDPQVKLNFHHRLSKLIFNIKIEGEDLALANGELFINGMKVRASYNLANDVLSVASDSGAEIAVHGVEGKREAIVLPRNAGQGVRFDFKKTNGRTYTAYMDKQLELKGGYKYTFNIITVPLK